MRIEQLRSFIALYETASFTAAAAQLYTSQPVVTRHLAQLEEELDGPLFTRTTRRVAPTKAGDLFYEKAREAILLIDKGIAECKALNNHNSRIAVGYEYLYMDQITTPWLEEYESNCSENIAVDVIEQPSPQLFDALFAGSIDCVFVGVTSEELIPAYLEKRRVASSMGENIFVGKTHPLATRACITIDDLLDEGFVYPLTKPTSRESIVARDFEERGKTPHSVVTLHQPSALSVVERGSAVINLPEGYGIESPNLVRIPYKSNHHIDYFFVWNRGNDNEAFEQFRAFIEQKITEFNG